MGKGTQGYLGELYIKDGSFQCKELIKVGRITDFTLSFQQGLREISTHGSLAKNKNFKNFERSFKTWSFNFKKIYVEDSLDYEKLELATDDALKIWLKIVPNKRKSSQGYTNIFIGQGLITSSDLSNSMQSAISSAITIRGSGTLFKLKEYDDCIIDFESGCLETAIANGCDLSQIGTSVAQVDIASIIQPPIEAPNLSLPISSFVNIGTQFATTPPAPSGWTPTGDLSLVGSGRSTFSFYSGSSLKNIFKLSGFAKPPNYPVGFSWLTTTVISAIVPGSYFYSVNNGNKFEPVSIQRSFLVPLPEVKYCLIDSGLGTWKYNAWLMLITEFADHGAPTLGKEYSIDFRIEFYDKDRAKIEEFNMPNYSAHNAMIWYDPDMKGSVPIRARYWRAYVTWNNPDLIVSNNFYGSYGYFLDYRTYNLGLRFNF